MYEIGVGGRTKPCDECARTIHKESGKKIGPKVTCSNCNRVYSNSNGVSAL